ncbi:hypothetical protein [Bacillus suaedaesalsae]|uniref:TnsA endonuclease N-terminal domain-containing protein n=1 Tax=Bacillus suaedaesalsae TaxID=2810349 RepID=A0ABS2DCK1_9BACI|nr:hypothetical protein [Bacillus suaedaesalsae]MBM6616190.1 hypothetical protein [Bacillus suaedaesalsae]
MKNKNWSSEDVLYIAKREVNNKQSKYIKHISGYLHSHKMNRRVGYESLWGECLFYYIIELDTGTIRYYEQPIEVPVKAFNDETKQLDEWYHIPDVLVFREGEKPHLYQIKGTEKKAWQLPHIHTACHNYASKNNREYSLIAPKSELPEVIKSNMLFLWNFIKIRKNYEPWIKEIEDKVLNISEITVLDLAKSFSAKVDYRLILPIIWHLVSVGRLNTDINKPLDQHSLVVIGNISFQIERYISLEEKI